MKTFNRIRSVAPDRHGGREGSSLAVVLVMLLVVSILALGLLQLAAANVMEATRAEQVARAFWTAESGLQEARRRLVIDEDYRDAPDPLSGPGGSNCTYSVSLAKTGTVYTLTSVGRHIHSGMDRVLRQQVLLTNTWPYAFDYALFGAGGEMEIGRDAVIDGSVFQYGDITIEPGGTITDYTIATGDIYPGRGASYEEGELPYPLPEMPTLVTTYYDYHLSVADSSAGGLPTFPLDVSGTTVYVKNNLNIDDDITCTSSGMLVVAGNLQLSKDIAVGPHVTIIVGGDLTARRDLNMEHEGLIYVRGDVTLKKDNLMLGHCTLLTSGDVTADKSFVLAGILMAEGTVQLDKGADITGSIVAVWGIDV